MLAAAAAAVSLTATHAAPVAEIEVWSHLMGNSLNNGLGVHYGINASYPVVPKFSYAYPVPKNDTADATISNLVSDGTRLFIAVNYQPYNGTFLFANSAATGALLWSVPLNTTSSQTHVELLLTGTSGHVIVHVTDGNEGSLSYVTAYHAVNGSRAWAQTLPAVITLGGGMVSVYNNVTGKEYIILSFENGVGVSGSVLYMDVNQGGKQLPGPTLAPPCGQVFEVPNANAFM